MSVSVVSRALNNSGYVEKEKKKRILTIAQELGYHPNPVAMSLQTKQTKQLLFFCKDLSNAFYIDMYRGMLRAAVESGYTVLLSGDENFSGIRDRMIDGLIMPNENVTENYLSSLGKNYHLPLVSARFSNPVYLNRTVPSVEVDMYRVMEIGISYLRNLGHKKIALALPYAVKNLNARQIAFRNIMTPVYENFVNDYIVNVLERPFDFSSDMDGFHINTNEDENFFLEGKEAAKLFLERKIHATAIIAFNDEFAIGMIRFFQEKGIHIPDEISVIGIDGTHIREYSMPSLTSISTFPSLIGSKCVEILLRVINGEKYKYITRILPKVLHGETVKKIR